MHSSRKCARSAPWTLRTESIDSSHSCVSSGSKSSPRRAIRGSGLAVAIKNRTPVACATNLGSLFESEEADSPKRILLGCEPVRRLTPAPAAAMIGFCRKTVKAKDPRRDAALDSGPMIELPEFSPLRTTATSVAPTRAALDRLDHLLVVAPRGHDARPRPPAAGQHARGAARARDQKRRRLRELARREYARHGPDRRHVRRRTRLRSSDMGRESAARMHARQTA